MSKYIRNKSTSMLDRAVTISNNYELQLQKAKDIIHHAADENERLKKRVDEIEAELGDY